MPADRSKDVAREIEAACRAHTNLSMFAAVVSLLESGSVYGDQPEVHQIVRICHRAEQRLLREYDRHAAAIRSRKGAG